MIHGLALHRAPIFLSRSAVRLAFLSTQDYRPGRLVCQSQYSFDGAAPKILWFNFWKAGGGGMFPSVVVHSYPSFSGIRIEKQLLIGPQHSGDALWREKKSKDTCAYGKSVIYTGIIEVAGNISYSVKQQRQP